MDAYCDALIAVGAGGPIVSDAHHDDFDAGQIYALHRGVPDSTWHSVALLRVVERACVLNPHRGELYEPGVSRLRHRIAVTSAAARLAERGYDIDGLVRFGFGSLLVNGMMGLAIDLAWLSASRPDPPDWWQEVASLIAPFSPDASRYSSPADFVVAVQTHDRTANFVVRLVRWIESAELRDLILWLLPSRDEWEAISDDTDFVPATADPSVVWIRDRFLQTYVKDWKPTRSTWSPVTCRGPRSPLYRCPRCLYATCRCRVSPS